MSGREPVIRTLTGISFTFASWRVTVTVRRYDLEDSDVRARRSDANRYGDRAADRLSPLTSTVASKSDRAEALQVRLARLDAAP